jgi:hypothetical protein
MVGHGTGFHKSELYRRGVMLAQNASLKGRSPRLWNALASLAALVLVGVLPARSFSAESAAQEEDSAPPGRSSAVKKVDFFVGPQKFTGDDKIEIKEVWSEKGSLVKGDTVTVKGIYTLYSRPIATMLLAVTTSRSGKPQGGSTLEQQVESGIVPFEMKLPITTDGHLHLSLYDVETHGCFAVAYFGTYPQMQEIAQWDVSSQVSEGRKTGHKATRKATNAKPQSTTDASPSASQPKAKKRKVVIGPQNYTSGDKIVIEEVWSTRGTLAKGDTVTVKGTYTLYSRPIATMLLGVTTDLSKGPQGGSTTERQIEAGNSVPFEVELPITVHGHLHVSLYDVETHGSIGNVYFGTYPQMQEIADWDLSKW